MNKFFSLLALPFVVLGIAVNCTFAQEFPDVSENHWAYKEIETLAKEGVVVGYPDGTFKADSLVDRAEFSTMVIKALAQEHSPIKVEIKFEDVPYSHWAYDMIQRAVYFELIDGNAKNFYPEGYVTKAHSVSVAVNALETRPISHAKALVVLSENYDDFNKIVEKLNVIDKGSKDGNNYLFYSTSEQYNYVLLIKDSKTAVSVSSNNQNDFNNVIKIFILNSSISRNYLLCKTTPG